MADMAQYNKIIWLLDTFEPFEHDLHNYVTFYDFSKLADILSNPGYRQGLNS